MGWVFLLYQKSPLAIYCWTYLWFYVKVLTEAKRFKRSKDLLHSAWVVGIWSSNLWPGAQFAFMALLVITGVWLPFLPVIIYIHTVYYNDKRAASPVSWVHDGVQNNLQALAPFRVNEQRLRSLFFFLYRSFWVQPTCKRGWFQLQSHLFSQCWCRIDHNC